MPVSVTHTENRVVHLTDETAPNVCPSRHLSLVWLVPNTLRWLCFDFKGRIISEIFIKMSSSISDMTRKKTAPTRCLPIVYSSSSRRFLWRPLDFWHLPTWTPQSCSYYRIASMIPVVDFQETSQVSTSILLPCCLCGSQCRFWSKAFLCFENALINEVLLIILEH